MVAVSAGTRDVALEGISAAAVVMEGRSVEVVEVALILPLVVVVKARSKANSYHIEVSNFSFLDRNILKFALKESSCYTKSLTGSQRI